MMGLMANPVERTFANEAAVLRLQPFVAYATKGCNARNRCALAWERRRLAVEFQRGVCNTPAGRQRSQAVPGMGKRNNKMRRWPGP